jgi:arginase
MEQLKIVEVRSEIAAGTRGASLGVDAIKVASLEAGSSYFSTMENVVVEDENKVLFVPNRFVHAKYIDSVLKVLKRVRNTVQDVMKNEGKFPIVLAGDHSTAAGTILGIKAARPHQRLGVIWIDAHADIHSPYTTPTGNMHGMPLAMVTGIDNEASKINTPDEDTLRYWDKIKNLGTDTKIINPEDIVYFVVRDVEEQEAQILSDHNILNITVDEIKNIGIKAASQKALDHLNQCDIIYVSFDVDSIDAKYAKGTGTPVPQGLTVAQAKELNEELIKSRKVCAWEMVEVNPTLDSENNMAKMAFEILEATTDSLIRHF